MVKIQILLAILFLLFLSACTAPLSPAILDTTATLKTAPVLTDPPVPSPTLIPSPTFSPTGTRSPTATATFTATPDPKVDEIRRLVGDRPENWFHWNEEIQGWEIWLIYPRPESISQETFELLDGNGKTVGKAWAWFMAEYLIGNEIRQIRVPYVWQNYATGQYSAWIVPLGTDEDWTGWGGWLRENYLTEDQKWVPGQVVIVYLNEPARQGELNDHENLIKIEATHFFYAGKDKLLADLLEEGNAGMEVLLTNLSQMVCVDPYQARTMWSCWKEDQMIVIPGYE